MDKNIKKTPVSGREEGYRLKLIANRKYRLTVLFGLLTEKELKQLRALTREIFVTVKFQAPEGEVTEEFHISDEPAPAVTVVNGVTVYGGVKLTMQQK